MDGRIPSHVKYGARHYRYGYVIASLALPLFIATYTMLVKSRTRGWKCFSSFFPNAAVVAGSMWVFSPEIPHGAVTGWSAGYSMACVIATWVRYSPPDLAFVYDLQIPLQARLEGLKSILTMWQVIAVAAGAGFFAAL